MKTALIILIVLLIACTSDPPNQATAVDLADTSSENNINTISTTTETIKSCPDNMVEVKGEYCSNLQEICLRWLDAPLCLKKEDNKCVDWSTPMRCAEFKNPTVCQGQIQHLNFCIDKYEAPNKLGSKPTLQITWYQAKASCESQRKRLCTDKEWTQACRGPNNLPYPYGYIRDATACRIDLPWQDPNTHTFAQLDKTVPSGSMPLCVSEYGVYDLTGNADEWAISSGGTPYQSVLKGGHPHGVRNRCSPETTGHNEYFSYYDIGFRCCQDTL